MFFLSTWRYLRPLVRYVCDDPMIPLRLTLKNFLSYREATLNFQGLHTACICGANGAGKSSLLEAIAWAIWGESRASSEDDVIHLGAAEALVDFVFSTHQHTYRIIRSRQRGQGTTLDFQIAREADNKAEGEASLVIGHSSLGEGKGQRTKDEGQGPIQNSKFKIHNFSFRSLTAKGVRATQQLILEHVKLDYETFINSAYLRQGRADEFMLKRPGERKQILADLLKLNQYDELADRAKDRARQLKGQIEVLESNLQGILNQLQQQDAIAQEQSTLAAVLEQLQQQQAADTEQLQTLRSLQHQRQAWHQQLTWHQQQQQILEEDYHRLQQELVAAHHQHQELSLILSQESTIADEYARFQSLQAQEEHLATQFKQHQQLQTQRQRAHQQQTETTLQLQNKIQQVEAQLEALQQQEQEIQHALRKASTVEEGLQKLQQARAHLSHLEQLHLQASPLLQRQQQLQTELDRHKTRLLARLEEVQATTQQLQIQQKRHPQLQQAVREISDRIAELDQLRIYQQQVRDKGLERRNFMERLQENQRTHEIQLSEVDQKIQLLQQETIAATVQNPKSKIQNPKLDAPDSPETTPQNAKRKTQNLKLLTHSFPPCPLCDRPLDEHHWTLVLNKHQEKRQEILDQIWVIREQLAVSEREIQILRKEYRHLDQQLNPYTVMVERRGQLQQQLQATTEVQQAIQQLSLEAAALQEALQTGTYATDLHEELQRLNQSLQQLNYDDKDLALARGEVDRWRWAEIKQAEIKQAQRRQTQIAQRKPDLQTQLATLQTQLSHYTHGAATQLNQLDQQLAELGYNLEQHNALRTALRQAQPWQLRYQELCRAQQTFPQVQQRITNLTQTLQERQEQLHILQHQIKNLIQHLEQTPNHQSQIYFLEQRLQQRRLELDEHLAACGRLQQQQQQLEILSTQHSALSTQLQTLQRQYRIYQELTQAFGKNGIQAFMIENVLPQLEAETNRILGRLSANQLHIQFVTQRSRTNSKLKTQNSKLIETLDILIADAHGTRPYETYSGGEAFRVNFAIRLALARLLAQRSGTALQLLIVDEGFGTQDAEGCDRLIAAINAIAPDFACILAVTHVPHFKEAFQSRIEVFKTDTGSQLQLVM
ncbi:MAG: AAA family ATPase [Leptodesmis sp.]|uniref:AAA family ATPase n=1 Tax=Leptodesmis sp. TaxID=3100501 RepID=UPI003D09ADE1